MLAVDRTYFKKQGELFIPNAINGNAYDAYDEDTSGLPVFIDKYERELLIDALGVTLYTTFEGQFTETAGVYTIKPSADQKWKDLLNGVNYTLNGKSYVWDGLKGYEKQSVVAYYIYTKYLTDDQFHYSTTGVQVEAVRNANPAGWDSKYLNVWIQFIESYQKGLNCFNDDSRRSLYQFLSDYNKLDATNFPDFKFVNKEPIGWAQNRYGI